MSDVNAPAGGADTSAPVSTPADDSYLSLREAADQLAEERYQREKPDSEDDDAAPKKAAAVEPEPELADEAKDAQPEPADPVEAADENDPALPIIDPPRSWTKEEKEEFATYPREAQEKIARREQDRERSLRQSQNEHAEKLKGLTAKEQQVEQARQQYEAALPELLKTVQAATAGEFADIKDQDDVNKLAAEDWPRFARWQAHMMRVGSLQQEVKASHDRQMNEFKTKWNEFASKEDLAAKEFIPELADPAKAAKLAETVMATVEKVGITKDDFAKAWTGEVSISPRDHRWQQIMVKAALYDQAKANAAKPAKPVPPVTQRPGVSKAPSSAKDAELQELEKAFERNPTIRNAAALTAAQRRSA